MILLPFPLLLDVVTVIAQKLSFCISWMPDSVRTISLWSVFFGAHLAYLLGATWSPPRCQLFICLIFILLLLIFSLIHDLLVKLLVLILVSLQPFVCLLDLFDFLFENWFEAFAVAGALALVSIVIALSLTSWIWWAYIMIMCFLYILLAFVIFRRYQSPLILLIVFKFILVKLHLNSRFTLVNFFDLLRALTSIEFILLLKHTSEHPSVLLFMTNGEELYFITFWWRYITWCIAVAHLLEHVLSELSRVILVMVPKRIIFTLVALAVQYCVIRQVFVIEFN